MHKRMPLCSSVSVLTILLALASLVRGQTDTNIETGLKAFGSYHGGDIDSVSFVNGSLDLHAPLFAYPQRGNLHLGFTLRYSNPRTVLSCIPHVPPNGDCQSELWLWLGTAGFGPGVQIVPDELMGWNSATVVQNGKANIIVYSLTTSDGTSHELSSAPTGLLSLDTSSLHFDTTTDIAITPAGVQYHLGTTGGGSLVTPTLIEDTNGNKITSTSTGFVDTLNRSIPLPPKIGDQSTATTDYSNCAGPLPIASANLWTLPGQTGGTTVLKLCFAQVSVTVGQTTGLQVAYTCQCNMLQSVVLPNGTAWGFQYDGAGNLATITLPTGGTISYVWSGLTQSCHFSSGTPFPQNYHPSITSRTVNANDGSGAKTWNYLGTQGGTLGVSSGNPYTVTVTDPAGNQSAHSMTALSGCSYYETVEKDYQGTVSPSNILKTVTTTFSSAADPNSVAPFIAAINVVPTAIVTTWANNKVSEIDKSYDTGPGSGPAIYGKVVTESTYDFGTGSRGSLLRTITNAYEFQSNSSYQTANLINLPASVIAKNGSGYKCAEADYSYDQGTPTSSGITTQHVSAPNSVRGNQTGITRQLSTAPCLSTTSWTSSISASKKFYDTGELYQSIDPLGNTTTYTYDSTTFFGAYVTQTQLPDTSSPTLTHHIVQDWYDFNTGLHTSHTDENTNPTTYTYDSMWRIKTITPPAPEGAITYTYTDSPGTLSVEKQQVIVGASSTTEYDLFDQMGRSISHVVDNGQGTYDKTDTCYDVRGLKSFVSYPYQNATWNAWPACPITQAGDSYVYDGLKRTTSVTHSDSTAIAYSYTGAATSTTDEGNGTRGVHKISQVDGLGRLVSVCEVTATNLTVGTDHTTVACGQDIAGTGFLTTYAYDGNSNLTSVSQGSSLNPRTFTYDSLSRLITTTNPEAGTTCFGTWSGSNCVENYDANSNVLSRTRPAPNQSSSTTYVTASFTYDALDRLRTKTYSDGATPSATINYDETSVSGNSLSNTSGRVSSEYTGSSSAMSSQSIMSYAAPGWVATDIQCTPQNCGHRTFSFSYSYDGVGDVTGSTNGNGISYTLSYSTGARLTQIATNWLSSTINSGNLISSVQYSAFAAPSSASLYNGLSETWGYDARGRLQSYSAKAGSTARYNLSSVTYSGNSNILSATDNVNGTWSSYAYDDFNRLTSSSCTANCPQSNSSLSFSYVYDRYGNRWSQTVTAGTGLWNQPSYNFDVNNRIASGNGFTYDAAGNIINDSIHAYFYDAENRIVKVDNGSTAIYGYDAEGRRVSKIAGSTQYEYLFDLGSRAVTELLAGTATTNRTEAFAGGRHVATQNVGLGTSYFIHTDWLGTERVRTSISGTTSESCSSLPYGDNLSCSGSDVSPLHFTGKMHDSETGLDEFPARYYSSIQGRWYSPDWASAQVPVPYADLHNPQSLNLYDYVGSDPTNHADADGHFCLKAGTGCDLAEGQQPSQNTTAQAGTANAATPAQNAVAATTATAPTVLDKIDQEFNAVANSVAEGMESGASKLLGLAADTLSVAGMVLLTPEPLGGGKGDVPTSGDKLCCDENGHELAPAAGGAGARQGGGPNETVITRPNPGADGGISSHIVEKDASGKTISVTHQVHVNGQLVHQHQTHVGKYGTRRQFPDSWVKHPEVNQ